MADQVHEARSSSPPPLNSFLHVISCQLVSPHWKSLYTSQDFRTPFSSQQSISQHSPLTLPTFLTRRILLIIILHLLQTRIPNKHIISQTTRHGHRQSLASTNHKPLQRVHGTDGSFRGTTGEWAGTVEVGVTVDQAFGLEEEACSDHDFLWFWEWVQSGEDGG